MNLACNDRKSFITVLFVCMACCEMRKDNRCLVIFGVPCPVEKIIDFGMCFSNTQNVFTTDVKIYESHVTFSIPNLTLDGQVKVAYDS